jgi:hypothetical protein
MAKTWVLDAETKGTGAHIAPLKRDSGRAPEKLSLVQLHPPASAERAEQAPPEPKRFKVFDVLSGRVLAQDVSGGEAVRALREVSKSMDALVYVREGEGARWRLLSLADTRALWALRERELEGAASKN